MKRLAVLMMLTCGLEMPLRAADLYEPLDARVTIDFRNAPGADVIGALAQAAGLAIRIDRRVLKPVTIALTNVKVSNALNAFCDNALCVWRFDGLVLHITPVPSEKSAALPARVSLEARDTLPTDLFLALGAAIGVPVTIESRVWSETPLNLKFTNSLTAQVLNSLCAMQQCDWDFDPIRGLRITQKR